MSACTHLYKVFELLCVFFISTCWAKNCASYNRSDYFSEGEKANVMAFGDCTFTETLCNYTQACTDSDSENWTVTDGRAVCIGNNKPSLDSFSILVSPLLQLGQNTSLNFSYSKQLPGNLSVLFITHAGITQELPEREVQDGTTVNELLIIRPSKLKIGFKARKSTVGLNVTLSNVKLQVVSFTPTPDHVTTLATSTLFSQPVTHLSSQAEDKGGNNAAIVAGVVVPVVVVVAVVVLGIFIWRRRRQQLHRNPKGVTRQDTGNASPFVLGTASLNTSSANGPENSVNTKNKSAHQVLNPSSTHYDIPRNGQPARCPTANTEFHRPFPRASPSAGDDDDHDYNIVDENITATPPQSARRGCSYATVQKHKTSNNPDADYNRIVSSEARRRGQSEAGYDTVEDDYSHISSTDTVAGVGPQTAASRRTDRNSTACRGDSGRDQHTSQASEDDYSVVSAGNKELKALSDQRSEGAEKASGHLTSNVEGDYDRIRREDREDVPGCDYDHVGRHTQDDYDQVGQRDKTKIIGNDYDHLA